MLGVLALTTFWLFVMLAPAGAAFATESCTLGALDEARKLILITTAGMSSKIGTLRTFEQADTHTLWKGRGASAQVVIGQNGLGWGSTFRQRAIGSEPLKMEGDRKTPAGIFRVGNAFGFEKTNRMGYFQLRIGETFCVNDPTSSHYNKIIARSVAGPKTSGEDMRSMDLYRRGIVIDYPTNAIERGGSCIFLHVWRSAQIGTAGCVAMPERGIVELQEWADNMTAIAIIPKEGLSRFPCLPKELIE